MGFTAWHFSAVSHGGFKDHGNAAAEKKKGYKKGG
jgi:hypothetical protein